MKVHVHTVQIHVTSHCNMACPECCCAIHLIKKKDKYFITEDYLNHSAKLFNGIKTISLMGGEPTMHPKFSEWSPKLKELFNCEVLQVETNGTMFKKIPEAFKHYDKIIVTRYHKDMFEGCRDNLSDIEFLQNYYPNKEILVSNIEHLSRQTKGTKPCYRVNSGGIAYADSKLYPCCVGPGLDEKVFIVPTDNWRNEIKTIEAPCEGCFFAV